jgi:hypothetical protein
MKGPRQFSNHTRDHTIGQYRHEKKRAWESPDMHDHVPTGAAVPIGAPATRVRPGMGRIALCAGCGRTADLWEENNGEGLSKHGRRFCCKPCAEEGACACLEMEIHNGNEIGGLLRRARRAKR